MFWRRKRNPEDFAEEVRAHLALESDELHSEGVPDARNAARRAFGNVTRIRERSYERDRWTWADELLQDVRYALRTMRRTPAYTAGAALLLALGIGANTAIYSFVEAVVLRPLPLPDPQSLVLLKWHAPDNPKVKHSISGEAHREPALGYVSGNFPYPAFQFLAANNRVLSTLFGFFSRETTVLAGGSAERVNSLFVSGEFFGGLRLAPALGRHIDPQDDRPDGARIAVLSHSYWEARFGASPGAVGQTIYVNNSPFEVIGVAPKEFFGVDPSSDARVYLPIRFFESLRSDFAPRRNSVYVESHTYWIRLMGRLRPGVSREQAQAALAASFDGWVAGSAETEAERVGLPALFLLNGASGVDYLRHAFSEPIFLIAAMAGLILTIACANLANLQLTRAVARRREIALRVGLGAGRWRIARQLLTESLVLSLFGGAFGVLFAWAGMRGLSALVDEWQSGVTFRSEMNWNCVLLSAGLTALTGLLFGLAPAIHASRPQLAPGLKEARAGAPAGWLRRCLPGGGLKSGLVAVQIAISLLLVAGASLFVRTVSNLKSVPLGFNPDRLLAFEVDARQAGHRGDAMGRYYGDVAGRLQTIPGALAATAASYALAAGSRSGTAVRLDANPSRYIDTAVLWVGPEFFSAMEIPIVRGRDITGRDTTTAPMVAVVNEAFVRKFMPGGDPVGRRLLFIDPENTWATIVGVSKDTVLYSLREGGEPMVFGAYPQHLARISGMTFLLRSASDSLPLAASARRVVASVDPRIPITNVRTLDAQIRVNIGRERLFAFLCSSFAVLALVIASVGLYATLAYSVTRRTGEIGVRMALGARRQGVIAMILRESLWMIAAGLALGLPFVLLSGKIVGAFLFGATANDPRALIGPVVVLLAAALIAAGLPAWRAARIDPIRALRHE